MSETNNIPNDNLLPALDVPNEPLRRAGINASMTQVQDGAKAAVELTMLNNILDRLRNKPSEHSFDPEMLDAKRLATIVKDKAMYIPEFVENDASTLAAKHDFIRQLSSGRPSHPLRLLADLAESVVNEEFSIVRQHLKQIGGINPYSVNETAQDADELIELLRIPENDLVAVGRLANVVRAQKQLTEDPSILPVIHRKSVAESLKQRGDGLVDAAMMAVCLSQVGSYLREAVASLGRLTREMKSFGGQFLQNVSDVRNLLEENRRETKHRDAANRNGVEIVLPGPDESSLVAAMLEQSSLKDTEDLITQLSETLCVRLSKLAKKKYPTLGEHATIGELLARISPTDIVSQLRDTIDQSIGTRHTVYSSLRGFSIREFGKELLRKASVLVNLGGYRHERLHIQPIDQVLVRFPNRVGDDDEQVYKDLCDEIADLFPGVLFADAGPGERDIKCVRTLIGFPFGVDQMNPCFLEAYSTCEPHPPHLYGLGSEDGQPISEVLSLHRLRTDSKPNMENPS